MLLKYALFVALSIHLANSDFICRTTGNFGCDLKCSLYKRGSGSCQVLNEKRTWRKTCVCLEEEIEEKRDDDAETTTSISVDEEESLWEEIEDQFIKEQENEDRIKESFTQKEEENKYLSWILKKLIFYPAKRKGFFGFLQDIEKPSTYGLNNAVNFRIPCENGSLGAWFLSPLGEKQKALSELNSNDTLTLYLHGSSATRGYSHRVEMYRKLTGMGYHVLAFDYRGYADSTDVNIRSNTNNI